MFSPKGRTLLGRNGLILYLDFDGVLHHERVWRHPLKGIRFPAPDGYTLFQHSTLLEKLLSPYPDVKIVLSTAWQWHLGYAGTAKKLSAGLREMVIGGTFHSDMNKQLFTEIGRGHQVWRDVCLRKPKRWLALDDDAENWPSSCSENLIQTDPQEGINTPSIQAELIRKLREMCT
jgi:hypothetical protein